MKTKNWKEPPTDGQLWINKSLEMQILLLCNWSCVACDQFSQHPKVNFVRDGTMEVWQVEVFKDELTRHNAYFGRVRVLGGEPTVHKDFKQIVALLASLVPEHLGAVEVVSNGSRPNKLAEVRGLAKIRVSGESQKEAAHVANLLHTPRSLGYSGRMCNAPWHCGISLNRWGYFPCSSGAGIARLEDWMAPWQRLSLPIPKSPGNAVREAWPHLQEMCDHCYHGLRDKDKVKCGTSDPERNKPGPHIAHRVEDWLAGKTAEWQIYGGGAS